MTTSMMGGSRHSRHVVISIDVQGTISQDEMNLWEWNFAVCDNFFCTLRIYKQIISKTIAFCGDNSDKGVKNTLWGSEIPFSWPHQTGKTLELEEAINSIIWPMQLSSKSVKDWSKYHNYYMPHSWPKLVNPINHCVFKWIYGHVGQQIKICLLHYLNGLEQIFLMMYDMLYIFESFMWLNVGKC